MYFCLWAIKMDINCEWYKGFCSDGFAIYGIRRPIGKLLAIYGEITFEHATC